MENSFIETDLGIVKYLNSKTCKQILEILKKEELIGKGFWGYIYKLDIKGHKVSVKVQPLTNTKYNDPSIIDPRNLRLEIDILKKLSKYKIENLFIHFPYFYKELECEGQSLMFYEYYDQNLKNYMEKNYTLDEFKNICKQILISIYFFQQVTGYYHNDIHVENFLVNKLDNTINQTYYFSTYDIKKTIVLDKFYISIWDFANAIPINNSTENIDYKQFKNMFPTFIKKTLNYFFTFDDIYNYCVKLNNPTFNEYYYKEKENNKQKWKLASSKNANKKIEQSMKKSLIYWIIENNLCDSMIIHFKNKGKINKNIFLPNSSMLLWIKQLPNSLNETITLFD